MALIVAGKLIIKPGLRDKFIEKSIEAVTLARNNRACEDFSVSPDPIDPARVNIFERWKSRFDLDEFRSAGPATDVFSLVEVFEVHEYEISA